VFFGAIIFVAKRGFYLKFECEKVPFLCYNLISYGKEKFKK
jgi:hypothetical protein